MTLKDGRSFDVPSADRSLVLSSALVVGIAPTDSPDGIAERTETVSLEAIDRVEPAIQVYEVVLPTPVFPPPEVKGIKNEKWQREYRAFHRLLPELLASCRGQYVAVHEEQVVDRDADELALGRRVYERFGYIPIYFGLVAEQQPVIRIPYRRPEFGRGLKGAISL